MVGQQRLVVRQAVAVAVAEVAGSQTGLEEQRLVQVRQGQGQLEQRLVQVGLGQQVQLAVVPGPTKSVVAAVAGQEEVAVVAAAVVEPR